MGTMSCGVCTKIRCSKKRKILLAGKIMEDDVQEKPPEAVAEVTANEYSSSQENKTKCQAGDLRRIKCKQKRQSDPPEPSKLFQDRETGKELRTLSKALAQSRQHLKSVKKGGQYFHILHQESLQKKTAVKQPQRTSWSLAEDSQLKDSGEKKKMALRSFAPVYVSVLIPNRPGAKSEHLFRQLCAMHWLLEALTLESNSQMRSLLTCWDPINPGGHKKTQREIEEEELVARVEELFLANTTDNVSETLNSLFRSTSTSSISQLSRQSSLRGQTSRDSITSSVLGFEDSISLSSSDEEEQPPLLPSLQKVIQKTHEKASKDVHKQEVMDKKTGLKHLLPESQKTSKVKLPFIKDQESTIASNQSPRRQGCHIDSFTKSKSNVCDNMRQKFTAVQEAAAYCLHDTLESLERSQEERSYKKYHALKHLKYFSRDIERIRELDREPRKEYEENWFTVLLARLPESVKSDHYVQKILKKLEKFSNNPDLKIRPGTFVKVLADLQVWELCAPEIAAAAEFVCESIVKMPEKDFNEWLQTKLDPVFAQSSTF